MPVLPLPLTVLEVRKSLISVDFGCEIYHLKTQDTHYLLMCLIPRSRWTWKRTQGSHPAELPLCNSRYRRSLPPLPGTAASSAFLFSTYPGLLISGATLSMPHPAPTWQPFRHVQDSLVSALLQVKNSFLPQLLLKWCHFEIFPHPDLPPSFTSLHILICSKGLKTEDILPPESHPQNWHRMEFHLPCPGHYISVDIASKWYP